MEIEFSLLIYFIIIITLFISLKKLNYTTFSAFFIAVVFSVISLLILHPVNSEDLDNINSENSLYFTILGFSGIIFILYSMIMAINDVEVN